jgi:GxxExxY protein
MNTSYHRDTESPRGKFDDENKITEKIIKSAIEVHKNLGPGLLESIYEECLYKEFELNNINFIRQKELPIVYKNITLTEKYRVDLIVENSIIIEIKCVENILPVHEAQLLTYLKLTGLRVGLILNFYSDIMKNGIKRIVL